MRTGHVYGGWLYVHQLQHRRADDLDTAAKLGDTPASMVREDAPPSVLSRLLDPIGRCLTPEGAQRLVAIQVDQAAEARLEELAEKCTEGQLLIFPFNAFVQH